MLGCPGLLYFAILMSAGLVSTGLTEVGPVVAGHIEVSLCRLFLMYHT